MIEQKITTGCLIFYSGRGFISRVIEAFTHNKISHVGIIYTNWDNNPVVAEALKEGFITRSLAYDILTRKGNMWIAIPDPPFTNQEQIKIRKHIKKELGDPYSIPAAIEAGLKIKWLEKNNGEFCDREAIEALQAAGLFKSTMASITTPAELWDYVQSWQIYKLK